MTTGMPASEKSELFVGQRNATVWRVPGLARRSPHHRQRQAAPSRRVRPAAEHADDPGRWPHRQSPASDRETPPPASPANKDADATAPGRSRAPRIQVRGRIRSFARTNRPTVPASPFRAASDSTEPGPGETRSARPWAARCHRPWHKRQRFLVRQQSHKRKPGRYRSSIARSICRCALYSGPSGVSPR